MRATVGNRGMALCVVGFMLLPAEGWVSTTPPAPPAPAAIGVATRPVLRVEHFSPQGSSKGVRQVSVRFNTPVVALGDPRLPDPFVVDCAAHGQGRWADGRNWVYDFDEDLPAGLACRFTPIRGLKALDGATLATTRGYSFDTGGPAVVASLPREGWTTLDEAQVFLLRLDAPATPESIRAHASCLVEGVSERIGVELLQGEARAAVLKERTALGYDYFRLLWKDGQQSQVRVRNRAFEHAEDAVTVLRCERHLPPGTAVRLVWGRGIATSGGIATRTDQTLAFQVRPAFIAQVECTRSNARAGCVPMRPIEVDFSAPVPREQALGVRLHSADGQEFRPEVPGSARIPTLESVTFNGPFPDDTQLTVILPAQIQDDAGRSLENAAHFPMQLRIDPYPALAKFSGTFGILESREGGILPVTLRNLEGEVPARMAALPAKLLKASDDPAVIARWLQRVEKANEPRGEWVDAPQGSQKDSGPARVWREQTGTDSVFGAGDVAKDFHIDKPAGPRPAEVIGIPLKSPGFYVVELQSRRLGSALLGRDQVRYVSTGALVTNMAVHFQWGRESSRVWVTALDSGRPVGDAEVSIIDYCSGEALWQGRTGRDGVAAVQASLGTPGNSGNCEPYAPPPRLVMAKKDGDVSFTQSGWGQGIDPYQFSLPVGSEYEADIFHTVLDRTLFRAGETVSMKHYLRQHRADGLGVQTGLPAGRKLVIVHQGSGARFEQTLQFGRDGIAESQWVIPSEAKLGDYRIAIVDAQGRERTSGQFKVEQFRLPGMRGSVDVPAVPLVRPQQVSLNVHVAWLSGGGAGGLPIKVRSLVEPAPLTVPGYDDYRFGGKPVKEGIVEGGETSSDLDFETGPPSDESRAKLASLNLDAAGSARVTLDHLPQVDEPAMLTAEVEYADANGELLTSSGRVRLVPAALTLGIRPEGWVASSEQMRFRVLALDLAGKPRADQALEVSLYQSSAWSYRKRLIGGFYAYETTTETRKLAPHCSGRTNAQGILFCELAPGVSGEVLVRAEGLDAQGARAGATTSIWVVGKDDWWFGGTSGDRMDVLPEKKEYEAGEVARLQVRMPFRSATALVSVQREGVLSSFVTTLKGRMPVIEVPVEARDAPDVFVSVLAVRGRVPRPEGRKVPAAEQITALVDLNKPAYRLGIAQIKVGWKPHRLDVVVNADHDLYPVRGAALVRIHAARADGGALPSNAEVALAAVDEALLDLAPNPSWDLLAAMMGERGLEVWTSTAQMQVVGKRHYGRKAVAHGGGGGRELDRAREKFDSLLRWQARVPLDANGDAQVRVPMNDSLSAFRIVAVASAGEEYFGTGSTTVHTSQDLILLSGLPPLVREQDRFAATFTVRNTTDHPLRVVVEAEATGLPPKALAAQRIDLAAGGSSDVSWPVQVPLGVSSIAWRVAVRNLDGAGGDQLRVSQQVQAAVPVRTFQATLAQLDAPLSLPVERPREALEGRGGLEITLRARLGDGLTGVREYMDRYPYPCLEQQISRAVALRDRTAWDAVMRRLPAYLDRDGLLKYFPTGWLEGEDTLSAYVLAISAEAGYPIPDTDKQRMVGALRRFATGKLTRASALPTADLTIRRLAAIDALSRHGAATAAMLDPISVDPDQWPTSAVIDWLGILDRVPDVKQGPARRRSALGILRARLNFQGTTLGFASERRDALWWLMVSGDSNANRLLLAVMDEPGWREDVPRLVRGALGRQQSGHWNTTVANAWGVLAMEKFSRAFESVPVTGATAVQYGAQKRVVKWPIPPAQTRIDLPWSGMRTNLGLAHAGSGRPWVMVRATAAIPLDKPLSTGFRVTRTWRAVEQQRPGVYTRGDVIRVHLDLEAQSDMSWVVVDDPVPAGATVLGSGVGGQSALDTRGERAQGWGWLAFEERRFDAYRAYYRFVPKGRWSLEYTLRLNNPGTLLMPPTRVEAMYAPEMFAELPNAPVTVEAMRAGP